MCRADEMPQNQVVKSILLIAIAAFGAASQDGAPPKNPSGTITIPGNAKVTPGTDARERPLASIHEVWTVETPCECDKLTAKQEINGYIDRIRDGKSNKLTARDNVAKAVSGINRDSNPEVDNFLKDNPPDKDKSEAQFIPDIGKHGSSMYPKNLLKCAKLPGGKSSLDLTDEPGVDATAPTSVIDAIKVRLTFRTTILCDGKEIGSFVWHFTYDLPGGKPEVALGEIK